MAKEYSFNAFDHIAKLLNLTAEQVQALKNGNFEIVFTVGELTLDYNAEDVRSGKKKGFKGRKFGLEGLYYGLEELKKVFTDPKILEDIIRNAYNRAIRPVLQKKAGKPSLQRGGRGSGYDDFEHEFYESPQRKAARKKAKGKKLKTRGQELGEKWTEIWNLIVKSDIRQLAPGTYGSFSMRDIMKYEMAQYSPRAKFRNVYMMVEFGTGEMAKPGPRRYQSRQTTPFKIWPALSAFGGNTSWWFTFWDSIMHARAIAGSYKKLLTARAKKQKTKRKEPDYTHIFDFAHGEAPRKAIYAHHIIFDARGMTLQLRQAYKRAHDIIAQELENELRSRYPNWPKGIIKFTILNESFSMMDFSSVKKEVE